MLTKYFTLILICYNLAHTFNIDLAIFFYSFVIYFNHVYTLGIFK